MYSLSQSLPKLDSITIMASDPNDYYVRDWNIFNVNPGIYQGNGVWSGGTPIMSINLPSDSTWTIELEPGNYWFVIGQTGGSDYGTYSGTINGKAFSNADINNPIQFTVGNANIESNFVWIAIGAAAIIVGVFFVMRRKKG